MEVRKKPGPMTGNPTIAVFIFLMFVWLAPTYVDPSAFSLSQASSTHSYQEFFGKFVVPECMKRLQGQNITRCVDEDRNFLCNNKPRTTLSLGRIKYCVSFSYDRFSIQKVFSTTYNRTGSYHTLEEMQAKFNYALNEMRQLYAEYGIDLNFRFERSNSPSGSSNVIFQDNLNADPYMYRIPLMHKERALTTEQFTLLLSHELSHHLGLPDRYQSDSCPLRVVSSDSLMGHKYQSGHAGMMLSEDDLKLLLDPLCGLKGPPKPAFFR